LLRKTKSKFRLAELQQSWRTVRIPIDKGITGNEIAIFPAGTYHEEK